MLHLEQGMVSQNTEQMLYNMIKQRRIPQALIIEGDHEKAVRLAQILAQAILCDSLQDKPCGNCSGCIKVKAGSHPDFFTAEGGLTPRSFKVETIRQIRSDAYVQSQEGGFKVYLLMRAESMSAQAQNALLKILEEPPAQTVFLLTCPTANSLLQTVRSRAQMITVEHMPQRNPQAVQLAAQMAQAVLHTGELQLLQITAPLIKDKELLQDVLESLLLIFRDACVQRAGGTVCLSGQTQAVDVLCNAVPRAKLQQLTQVVEQAQNAVTFYANATILVTALCAELRMAAGR